MLIQRKWIISLLGTYACGLMYVQRAGTSVAMVRMTDLNSTSSAPKFEWSETLQGIILGAIFYLYWIVPTIVGSFTERFGGKWLAFIGMIVPCILTALAPYAATINVGALIAVQTTVGAAQGFIYPSLFHLYVQWFEPKERSKPNSGIQVGQAFGGSLIYLLGGYLCETSVGWPMVFYVVAAFHIPWIFLWIYFARDKPEREDKVKYIEHEKQKKFRVPWVKIATSGPVWASILSKFACSYGFYMLLSKLPAYLNAVYRIPIVENGFINSATYMSYGIACILSPYLSNWMINNTRFTPLMTRKIFQGIAMLVPAICLMLVTIINQKNAVIAFIILAMFGYGFVTGGEWTMVSDYSPNCVGTVSGFTSILGFTTGVLAPYIVGLILDSNIGTLEFKWNISFYIASSFYILTYVAFWFMCSDQQQKWDKISN